MTKGNWRGYVVVCAFLALLSAYLSFSAFSSNSWGKWQRRIMLQHCWALPPPFGCADLTSTTEVLTHRETDFSLMCLFCFAIYLWIGVLCLSLLASEENSKIFGMNKIAVANSILRCFVASVVFGIIICLIASYRLNAIYQSHIDNCVYDVGGYQPVYSTSFYAVLGSSFLAFLGSLIITSVYFDDLDAVQEQHPAVPATASDRTESRWRDSWSPWRRNADQSRSKPKGTSRTTKQHVARNLLYPEDQQLNKMITFSSMSPAMEEVAADICMKAVMRYSLEEDIAEHVKLSFEEHFGPTWQCIVGDSFGSCVHHRSNEYVEVAMPKFSVLLYRCNEPPSNRTGEISTGTEAR